MRGLTARERVMLQCVDSHTAEQIGIVIEEMHEQVRLGRFRKAYEDDEKVSYASTDLGDLALRVCPVDEH